VDGFFNPDFNQEDSFLSPYLIGEKNLRGLKSAPPPVEEKKVTPPPKEPPPPEPAEPEIEDLPPLPAKKEEGIRLPIGSTSKRDKLNLSKVYNTLEIPDLPVPDRIQPPPPPVLKFSDSLMTLKNPDGTPLAFIQKKYLETEVISPEKKETGTLDLQEIFRDGKEAVLAKANKLLKREIPEDSRQRSFEMLEKMIVKSSSPLVKEMLKAELVVLGEQFIRTCKEHDVWIIILGRTEKLSKIKVYGYQLFGTGDTGIGKFKRKMDQIRGVFRTYKPEEDYDLMWKIVIIGEELISGIYGTTSIHEFAHAYDHAKTMGQFGLSVRLWNKFYKERSGFITEYASTKPHEYFAESVEAFFHPRNHEKLQKCDPGMYDYLQNLFYSM